MELRRFRRKLDDISRLALDEYGLAEMNIIEREIPPIHTFERRLKRIDIRSNVRLHLSHERVLSRSRVSRDGCRREVYFESIPCWLG